MLNFLILLYRVSFSNFGVAIFIFTIIIRVLMLPLTLQQLKASKAMSSLQPKMQELQKKYGKDRERISQETMKLYKEHGVNPLGCALPTLVQLPIWIGLYQSIIQALADTPEGLLHLSQRLYPDLSVVWATVPLNSSFLWLDLAKPDPIMILPVLVAASMWVQQKMMASPSMDPQQAQMNRMMQVTMPMLFGFMTIQFASGLALYWVTSNIIGIVMQYFVTGWGSLFTPRPVPAKTAARPASKGGKKGSHAKSGKKR
jgi:YidC/Oxa1 family membrane protein insertase